MNAWVLLLFAVGFQTDRIHPLSPSIKVKSSEYEAPDFFEIRKIRVDIVPAQNFEGTGFSVVPYFKNMIIDLPIKVTIQGRWSDSKSVTKESGRKLKIRLLVREDEVISFSRMKPILKMGFHEMHLLPPEKLQETLEKVSATKKNPKTHNQIPFDLVIDIPRQLNNKEISRKYVLLYHPNLKDKKESCIYRYAIATNPNSKLKQGRSGFVLTSMRPVYEKRTIQLYQILGILEWLHIIDSKAAGYMRRLVKKWELLDRDAELKQLD